MTRMRGRQAISAALADEMRADASVMFMGEDVAAAGGAFKASEGLLAEFGPLRVRDTPISEMAFTGAAVGAAAVGMRPVVEIMFMEFLGCALDQLVTEAAKFSYLSAGRVGVPLTLRASIGSGGGFACQHSQTLENWVTGTPGLKVVVPSDGQTAYGLLRSAIRDPDPVVVLEPRQLYVQRFDVLTGEEGVLPIGRARVLRQGTDLTIVTLGATVAATLEAVGQADVSAEVVDLLTLCPWDRAAVVSSVSKTGRLVVIEEAPASGGWGHEIVSTVASAAFDSIRAAPFRITTPDAPVPYSKNLESRFAPAPADIARQLTSYLSTGRIPAPWWRADGNGTGP